MPEKNEYIIQFIATGSLLILLVAIFIVSFLFIHRNRIKKHLLETKIINEHYQKEILQTQLEIQEQTLKNISQEIHDNIGQALTLAKLNLNTMLPQENQELKEKIIASKELVSKAIGDLRDLSRSLDTDYVKEMGLQRAIEYELEMIRKTGIIRTGLLVEGSLIRLDKQRELVLFRIIQETFHNIIKHAEAMDLHVSVFYKPELLELLVADNGKGMDLRPLNEDNSPNFGLGIRNMHNRAKLIGAQFNMRSILGAGTQVSISLPLETNDNEPKK
jgi:two-component system, NarL family, sensor kinase